MRNFDRRAAEDALSWLPFFLFAAYVVAVTPLADDVWWRLHSGERILETGQVQTVNAWAYRDAGAPWVNHAAGHDVLAAAVRRAAGPTGLVFFYLAGLLGLAAALPRPRRRLDWLWALTWPPILAIHHALRPYVFSDVLFFLAVLGAARWHDREAPRWRDAAPLGVLFFLWGWLHGAVWPGLGFCLFVAVRWRALASAPARELARLLPLALLPAMALLNAHHFRGLGLAWRYATRDFAWLGRLTEWQPGPPVVLAVAGVFAAGLVLAWRARRDTDLGRGAGSGGPEPGGPEPGGPGLPLSRLLPLVPLAVYGVLQIRHLPWLVLGALALWRASPPEPGRAEPGREEPGREEPGREEPDRAEPGRAEPGRAEPGHPRRLPRTITAGLIAALALAAAWRHAPRLADPRFLPAELYIRMDSDCRLDGPLRVFTLHAWGGSLIYRSRGRLAPFLDARNDCFSRETFTRYFRITHLETGWYHLLWEDRPDAAALPPGHPLARALLSRGWTPGVTAPDGVFLLAPHRAGLCGGQVTAVVR